MKATLEIVKLLPEGEWWLVQCALDSKLAVPFRFHKSDRERFPTDPQFFEFLQRQTEALLESFGDARQLPHRGEREADT